MSDEEDRERRRRKKEREDEEDEERKRVIYLSNIEFFFVLSVALSSRYSKMLWSINV